MPFTLVGATTRTGLLTAPLLSRFGYVMRLVNRTSSARTFEIDLQSDERLRVEGVGLVRGADGKLIAEVGPDQTREIRVTATAPARASRPALQDLGARIVDAATGESAVARDHFDAP